MESIRNIAYKLHVKTKMAVLAEVSKSSQTFKPDILKKNAPFYLPQIQHLHDGIFSLSCDYTHCQNSPRTDRQTERHTHKTTTIALAAHACQGLITSVHVNTVHVQFSNTP